MHEETDGADFATSTAAELHISPTDGADFATSTAAELHISQLVQVIATFT